MSSLPKQDIDALVRAFRGNESIKLPARLSKDTVTPDDRAKYLNALLSHDPGVFLERHGEMLSDEQRQDFESLRRSSYEVDFYLKLLEDQEQAGPSKAGVAPISSTAKNRRLAKMARLAKEGYFDEDVARQRAPLLHHQYLGDQTSSSPSRPRASTLHDQIIQQHEEQEIKARMAAQKREEDKAGEAFEATLSESESDSELEDEDGNLDHLKYEKHQSETGGAPLRQLSESELKQNREDFRAIMEARFLNGEDGGEEADGDASLDEDWSKERTQDAEDKYFES